jgi:cytochrome c
MAQVPTLLPVMSSARHRRALTQSPGITPGQRKAPAPEPDSALPTPAARPAPAFSQPRKEATMSRLSLTLAALALGVAATPAFANLDLAKKKACTACHAVDKKVIGPAYVEVAKKYAGQKDAVDTIKQHIKAGGTGRWGKVPMPPQPQLSDADLTTLATWIAGGAK